VGRDVAWEVAHGLVIHEASRLVVDERSGGLLAFIVPLKTLGVDISVTLLLIPDARMRTTTVCAAAYGSEGRSPFYLGSFFRELEKQIATRTDQNIPLVDLKIVSSVNELSVRVEPRASHSVAAEAGPDLGKTTAALPSRFFPGFSFERVWQSSVLTLMQHAFIANASFRNGVLVSRRPSKSLVLESGKGFTGIATIVLLKPLTDGIEVAVAWNREVDTAVHDGVILISPNNLGPQDDAVKVSAREFLETLAVEVFAADKWSRFLLKASP